MRSCYLCGCELTDANTTKEHIFIQAIGGHLFSKELLCKTCNSTVGNTIDTVLAEQLNFASNLLDIQRDRGKPPVLRAQDMETGEQIRIEPGGKPAYVRPRIKESPRDGDAHYSVEAVDRRQAKEVIRGFKRKHPELDEEAILRGAVKQERYMKSEVTFPVMLGGSKAFRSVCKTAVNYYLYTGGSNSHIAHLRFYIKREEERQDVVFWAQLAEDPFVCAIDEFSHNIVTCGDPVEKLLYAYVDFFGIYRTIVVLNHCYNGNDLRKSYSYDVFSRKEIERSGDLQMSREQIKQMAGELLPREEIVRQLSTLIEAILRKQSGDHVRTLLERAVLNFRQKHPDAVEMTKEMCEELSNETMTQLTPWLLHLLNQNQWENNDKESEI